ncbi:hypothetical protein RJG79_12200 [Mycoplasmatota bacterium WC44]
MKEDKEYRNSIIDEAINSILESIAKEELALANILNAEGAKIDFIIRELRQADCRNSKSIDKILETSKSVRLKIITVIKNEMVLQLKLENMIELIEKNSHHKH